jgi:hypothetical protein
LVWIWFGAHRWNNCLDGNQSTPHQSGFEPDLENFFLHRVQISGAIEQIVGRERRERVSHHDWSGDA